MKSSDFGNHPWIPWIELIMFMANLVGLLPNPNWDCQLALRTSAALSLAQRESKPDSVSQHTRSHAFSNDSCLLFNSQLSVVISSESQPQYQFHIDIEFTAFALIRILPERFDSSRLHPFHDIRNPEKQNQEEVSYLFTSSILCPIDEDPGKSRAVTSHWCF